MIYVARFNPAPEFLQGALDGVERMLGKTWANPLSVREQSFAFNLRAQCHQFLGKMHDAQKDYEKSIRLAPDEPRWYLNRAQFWQQQGQVELEQSDREKARSLRSDAAAPLAPQAEVDNR